MGCYSFTDYPFADATKGDDRLPVGTEDYIHIRIQQRNGRKTLTTVQGIADDYDKKKLVKAFKKKFACNGTVIEHPEYGEVIQLQGDQRKNICQFIIEVDLAKEEQLKSTNPVPGDQLTCTWSDPFADATKGDDRLPVGTEDYIHIRIQQRNGRKTLTTVQGISDDYDKKKLVKAFKKKFACNGTVIEHPEYGEVIQLQGDQRKNICQFIIEIDLAKEEQLKVHGF
ncbi:hypothetical protein L3Q82_013844 [Scortum barcoo]|uniref:Uncharacterized protein n=1 Tax=Scortum barcoo TaxID=214431 RepID=A0ACB8VX07_9TELE|nr:hypothetical protein L3Q82_013844 [Scortum barcoo]